MRADASLDYLLPRLRNTSKSRILRRKYRYLDV